MHLGDGAGVGKGRTVAGVIYENYLKGQEKAIWVSVSNDLKYDAERDLEDVGAPNIEVQPLNKVKINHGFEWQKLTKFNEIKIEYHLRFFLSSKKTPNISAQIRENQIEKRCHFQYVFIADQ